MPVDDLHVDPVRDAAARAERELAERAEVRVVVDLDLDADPRAQLLGGVAADPARKDRRRVDHLRAAVVRAGKAHARADDAVALDTRLREHVVDEPRRRVERLVGVVVDVDRSVGSRRGARRESATATRTCEWPRSMPSATPADGSSRSSAGGGRGRRSARRDSPSSAPTTRPALWRSARASPRSCATARSSARARCAWRSRCGEAHRRPAGGFPHAAPRGSRRQRRPALGQPSRVRPLLSRAWLKNTVNATRIPPRRG